VQARERASHPGVISRAAQLQVLEHEEGLAAFLSTANRRGDAAAGGERGQAVGLGGEVVELRARVDLREVLATVAFEDEAAMDAAAAGGCDVLDAKYPCGLRDRGL
jgi:uncharacterized cupredoxin-like copper-binding protein